MLALIVGNAHAQGKTELTFYYPIAVGGPLTKVIDNLVAGFEKENPNVKINSVYAGNYDDARIKALAAQKAGQPAQMSVLFSIDIYELLEQDLIVPFDDMATTAADKAWLKSFYPALMANGTYKGKVYGIPFQRSTIVMYWNKDAFKEAGLDPEKAPANWNEMQQMAAKLVKKDAARQRDALGRDGALDRLRLLDVPGVRARERPGPDERGRQPHQLRASRRHCRAAVLGESGKKTMVMPEGTVEWGTLRQNFVEGKTAIMWHTTGNLTAVKDSAKFPFGVAMLPASKQRGSPTGGGNWYIFKKSTPGGAQGGVRVHQVGDRARARRGVEHRHRLRRR